MAACLHWGILGTARIARKRMIKAMHESDGNDCLAVASRSTDRAQELATEFGIARYYDSYRQLLDDPDINVVYIPLPNSLHHEWVLRAAESGKHVLCEKPLASTFAQAREMVDACRNRDVVLMEAFSYSLHPQYHRLAELLRNEVIGGLGAIDVRFSFPAQRDHAIRFQRELGGGTLLDIGCYGVDLVQGLYEGEPDFVDAVARIENGVDVEFLGLLRFSEGREATIRTSFLQDRRQTVVLSGEKGHVMLPHAFVWPDREAYLAVNGETYHRIETIEPTDHYALLIEEFRRTVLSREDMSASHHRYLRNARTIERIRRLIEERNNSHEACIS